MTPTAQTCAASPGESQASRAFPAPWPLPWHPPHCPLSCKLAWRWPKCQQGAGCHAVKCRVPYVQYQIRKAGSALFWLCYPRSLYSFLVLTLIMTQNDPCSATERHAGMVQTVVYKTLGAPTMSLPSGFDVLAKPTSPTNIPSSRPGGHPSNVCSVL